MFRSKGHSVDVDLASAHSRVSGNPESRSQGQRLLPWVPAFAGTSGWKCAAAAIAFAAGMLASPAARAWDQYPFDEYLQRNDTVTMGAGDSQKSNTVTHTIDPWPRSSANTRIPGNGARMTGAIERYQDPAKLRTAPPPIKPIFDVQSSTTGGSSGGTSSGSQ